MDRRRVTEFDHFSPSFASKPESWFAELREVAPAWSDLYGGFWVLATYEQIAMIERDLETWSWLNDPEKDPAYAGIQIPPGPRPAFPPLELDPPEYAAHRLPLNKPFSAKSIRRFEEDLRRVVVDCLESKRESGAIDLVLDLANPVPAIMTMWLLGLPEDEWIEYAAPVHALSYVLPDSEEAAEAVVGVGKLGMRIAEAIQERKNNPALRGDDMISILIDQGAGGKEIPDQRLWEMVNLLIYGGVDTTTSLIAHAMVYLDQDLQARQRLIDEPALIGTAIEEFIRLATPVSTHARTANRDVVVNDQLIRKHDRVLIVYGAANRDPAEFDSPDSMVIDRRPNRHVGFGLGPHRCVGSHLARLETKIVLEEVLRRIPDYRLTEVHKYPSIGMGINGFVSLPAQI